MAMRSATRQSADLKVVILGSVEVGKTTLVRRYLDGCFRENIATTMGAAFSYKKVGPYNVAIWDTAGEERFMGLSNFYCRGAGAAILCYDLNDQETFFALSQRFVQLLEAANEKCLCVVVGTKLDRLMPGMRGITPENAIHFAQQVNKRPLQEIPYFETSSVTGHNVETVFNYIFRNCLPDSSVKYERESFTNSVTLHSSSSVQNGKDAKGKNNTCESKKGGCGCVI